VKFFEVGQAFQAIEEESSRLKMTELLAHLLARASARDANIICNLSLGQLNPPYIGTQFNMAEKNIIKSIAQLLDRPETEVTKQAKKVGDLGAVVYEWEWTLRQAQGERGDLTVNQVYCALQDLEQISGTGSQEEKINLLTQLLSQLDPTSAKYVTRIVLGKLRLGFSDMTIVDALSWMEVGNKSIRKVIEHAYNICADIGLIAQTLKENGLEAIEKMKIQVGIPIRPAAAERLPTAKAIFEKLGTCIAQPKLDGFRLQIHLDKRKKTPTVRFFSRNLQDMSAMFPDIVPAIEQLPVETMICEGEAIGYDTNTGNFLPFQETVKRKRKHGIAAAASEYPLKVFLFDLLYLNGKSYLDVGHEERRAQLFKIFKNFKEEHVHIVDEKVMHSAKELEDYFIHNIETGLEGLVVKRPNAIYEPGKRNFNWIKLKRQEEGHIEDTLDCVILGYYAGKGKRAGFGIGAFLVGVYNPNKDEFETIAKIGTGLTDDEWRALKAKCDRVASKTKPKNVVSHKDLTPDVWTYPEIVCLIRADEITKSPVHAAGSTQNELGYALRFPRFMGYRPDKSPEEATTAHEIKRLYEDQFKK
jgi:DNA ligase 1